MITKQSHRVYEGLFNFNFYSLEFAYIYLMYLIIYVPYSPILYPPGPLITSPSQFHVFLIYFIFSFLLFLAHRLELLLSMCIWAQGCPLGHREPISDHTPKMGLSLPEQPSALSSLSASSRVGLLSPFLLHAWILDWLHSVQVSCMCSQLLWSVVYNNHVKFRGQHFTAPPSQSKETSLNISDLG